MTDLQGLRDRIGGAIHAVHGTRALSAAMVWMFLLTFLEPLLEPGWQRGLATFPAFVLLVLGGATLPREGIAVQDRVVTVMADPDAPRNLLRHAVLPGLLVVLLVPRVFLALYGVPHLDPLTGTLLPSIQRRLAMTALYIVLWLPLLALRRTRGFADVPAARPRDLETEDPVHERRDTLILLTLAVVALWTLALHGFWQPFSLLQWPPRLVSLGTGVEAMARLAFVTVLPAALFVRASAYAHALGRLAMGSRDPARLAVVSLHLLLVVAAAGLHLYDVLWLVGYQAGVRF